MTRRYSLEKFAQNFAKWAGSTQGFVVALISLIFWLIAGKMHDFSIRWENALTAYIGMLTFLMVFLMQRVQNKELAALHVKLNELIAASHKADNKLISVEELTEKEIDSVQQVHKEIKKNQ